MLLENKNQHTATKQSRSFSSKKVTFIPCVIMELWMLFYTGYIWRGEEIIDVFSNRVEKWTWKWHSKQMSIFLKNFWCRLPKAPRENLLHNFFRPFCQSGRLLEQFIHTCSIWVYSKIRKGCKYFTRETNWTIWVQSYE